MFNRIIASATALGWFPTYWALELLVVPKMVSHLDGRNLFGGRDWCSWWGVYFVHHAAGWEPRLLDDKHTAVSTVSETVPKQIMPYFPVVAFTSPFIGWLSSTENAGNGTFSILKIFEGDIYFHGCRFIYNPIELRVVTQSSPPGLARPPRATIFGRHCIPLYKTLHYIILYVTSTIYYIRNISIHCI